MTVVHQATGTLGPYDAVTGQVYAYRELLREWGLGNGVYAALLAPEAHGEGRPLARLEPAPDDLLRIHYSGYVPGMKALLELPQRKLLVYHNITPARYFWTVEPRVALSCQLGRDYLPRYARAASVAAAVSAYNAGELRDAGAPDTRVVPILLDPGRLAASSSTTSNQGGPLVLSVGRLAPHKRPDLVIRVFALYQREHAPDARLLIAGPPLTPAYRERLERLVAATGARNVRLAGGLPQEELNAALAEAGVFLSMSEHEGFCIPLLEALHARVPVVARPAGGMREVGGDAVLWVDEHEPLSVVAELVHLAASDSELRAELERRATKEVEKFAPERVALEIRGAVEAALQ